MSLPNWPTSSRSERSTSVQPVKRFSTAHAMGEALQSTPFTDAAFTLAMERAHAGWQSLAQPPAELDLAA